MLSQDQESQVQESKNLLSQALQRYHYYGLLEEYQLHSNLIANGFQYNKLNSCLLYTSPSPRDRS